MVRERACEEEEERERAGQSGPRPKANRDLGGGYTTGPRGEDYDTTHSLHREKDQGSDAPRGEDIRENPQPGETPTPLLVGETGEGLAWPRFDVATQALTVWCAGPPDPTTARTGLPPLKESEMRRSTGESGLLCWKWLVHYLRAPVSAIDVAGQIRSTRGLGGALVPGRRRDSPTAGISAIRTPGRSDRLLGTCCLKLALCNPEHSVGGPGRLPPEAPGRQVGETTLSSSGIHSSLSLVWVVGRRSSLTGGCHPCGSFRRPLAVGRWSPACERNQCPLGARPVRPSLGPP